MANHEKVFGVCENKCFVEVSPKEDTDAVGTRVGTLEGIDAGTRLDTLESEMDAVQDKNISQDNRLTAVESKNTEQDNRLDTLEGINAGTRLTAVETKNTEQDTAIAGKQDKLGVDTDVLMSAIKDVSSEIDDENNVTLTLTGLDGTVKTTSFTVNSITAIKTGVELKNFNFLFDATNQPIKYNNQYTFKLTVDQSGSSGGTRVCRSVGRQTETSNFSDIIYKNTHYKDSTIVAQCYSIQDEQNTTHYTAGYDFEQTTTWTYFDFTSICEKIENVLDENIGFLSKINKAVFTITAMPELPGVTLIGKFQTGVISYTFNTDGTYVRSGNLNPRGPRLSLATADSRTITFQVKDLTYRYRVTNVTFS